MADASIILRISIVYLIIFLHFTYPSNHTLNQLRGKSASKVRYVPLDPELQTASAAGHGKFGTGALFITLGITVYTLP